MRVLIIGYGRMGRFHAKTLQAAGDTPVTLDPDPRAGAMHQAWPTTRHIDAAIIAAPIPHLHDQALKAIDRGLPVLLEKPAAATLIQANDLATADPTIAVGYLERGNPAASALFDVVPPNAHITYTRYGPRPTTHPGLDVASHDLDLHTMHTETLQAATLKHHKRGITLELDTATIHTGHAPWRTRTIEAAGYKADLVTRTLHHPDGKVWTFAFTDLLAQQWNEFKQHTPLATIHDACRVLTTLEHCGALDTPLKAAA